MLIQLRKAEIMLQETCGDKYKHVKIIEEGGLKLQYILVDKDTWGKVPCQRAKCPSCTGQDPQPGICRERSNVYKNVCNLCKKEDKVSR